MSERASSTAAKENPIRIVMVDDHALLRGALAKTLSIEPDLAIVGECSGVDEALALIAAQPVDIVLLDINLGSEQGGSFLGRARNAGYEGKVLVVTAGVSEREASWLLSRGCSGIFLKSEPLSTLVDRVRGVVRSPSEADAPAASVMFDPAEGAQGVRKPLTQRESAVLRYVCEGLTNKEIAQEMDVSEHSVKSFVQQLFSKTGARSRAQLVTFAIEEYWDQLDRP